MELPMELRANADGGATTVSARLDYDHSPLSTLDKERVLNADLNGGRCLITNALTPLNYCHCISRRTMKEENVLDSLEWAWNMKQHTLNLNSHHNVFLATTDFHVLFDQEKWLLLPEDRILDIFLNSLSTIATHQYVNRKKFPTLENVETFYYQFLPLKDMEADEKQIVRQNDRSLWKKDGSNLNTTHIYPYHALPELKSHIHPQFAIFDAGKKLAKLTELSDEKLEFLKVINDYPDRSSSIAKIQTLYGVWIRPPPKNAAKDISYVDPNEELAFEHEVSSIDDSNSKDSNYKGHGIRTNRTKSGRGDGLHLRPKTRSVAAAEQDDRSGRPRTRSVAAKRDGNGGGHRAKSGRMADKRKAAVRKRKI